MNTVKILIAIVASIASFQGFGADDLNWGKLETALENEPEDLSTPGMFRSALESRLPGAGSNTNMLVEMAVQTTYPFVAMAGISVLSQTSPELAFRISLNRLWSSTNNGSVVLLLPYLECLTNRIAPDAFESALSAVVLLEPRDVRIAIVAIRQLQVGQLAGWLISDLRPPSSATAEALVIDRLEDDRKLLTSHQLLGLQAKLQYIKSYPGIPRAIYLLHTDGFSVPLVSSVEAMAEDITVDITLKEMVFKKYSKKLSGLLDVDRMKISGKERERIKRWLDRYSQ